MSVLETKFRVAAKRYAIHDTAGAERVCREILRLDPAQAPALHLLGSALKVEGRYHEAVEAYSQALRVNPGHGEVYLDLGEALETLGETEAAAACRQIATTLAPHDPRGWQRLGESLLKQRRWEEAAQVFEAGILQCPQDATLLCGLGSALAQRGRFAPAIDAFTRALAIDANAAAAHFGLAHVYLSQRKLPESQAAYQRGLAIDPANAEGWKNLGCIFNAEGATAKAIACFERSVALQPDCPELHYNLGNALAAAGELESAIASYRRALALRPEYAEAHNNLGIALLKCGRRDEAIACFREAAALRPDDFKTASNLAHSLRESGELDEAILHCRRAAAIQPGNARLLWTLGTMLKECRRHEEAFAAYEQALQADPSFTAARYDLGNTCKHLGRLDEARRCYEAVLEAKPNDPSTLIALGNVLKAQDELPEAAAAYRKVLKLLPDEPLWELWTATLCPSVFTSAEEIRAYREQLAEDIRRTAARGLRVQVCDLSQRACPPPYNLQFHGLDDRAIKEAYAQLFCESIPSAAARPNQGRPRVGYVVTDGHEGVFLRYMRRVIEGIDPDLCEQVILCSTGGAARIRREWPEPNAGLRVIPQRIDQIVEALAGEPFDVLYFWEVGSDVTNYFLPFFRLGRVQCTSAGVLETSGVPHMDYYISSVWVEPEGGNAHYSERLLRASTFLSCQRRLAVPDGAGGRADFGVSSREHLYVCAQKIRKFHPDFDRLLYEILARDPNGRLIVPQDQHGHYARRLAQRFQRTLGDVFNRVTFLPFLPLPRYLALLAAADVLLDPLYYGGGLSAYDAFSLNRPVVTLPGAFARGRYTAGMYCRMGIGELIADTPEVYVERAVTLATDADFRHSMESRLREATPVLFDDPAVVREYERLYESLIAEARS